MNRHYYGGIFIVTLGYTQNELCGDMPMPDNCCDDESLLFAVEDDFQNITMQISVGLEFAGLNRRTRSNGGNDQPL